MSPRQDYPTDPKDEIIDRLVDAIGRHSTYAEGAESGESKLLWWILGIVGTLLVIVIVGGVTMYADVQVVKSEMANLKAMYAKTHGP